jgi:hypothetical protein
MKSKSSIITDPIFSWKRTTVSQEWIAEKLAMHSAANVSQQLRLFDRAEANAKLPPEMRRFLKQARDAEA